MEVIASILTIIVLLIVASLILQLVGFLLQVLFFPVVVGVIIATLTGSAGLGGLVGIIALIFSIGAAIKGGDRRSSDRDVGD